MDFGPVGSAREIGGDLLTNASAIDLADRINEFWDARGKRAHARPETWTVVVGTGDERHTRTRWVVRSDMVNGIPT
jgi:hypothetical protein